MASELITRVVEEYLSAIDTYIFKTLKAKSIYTSHAAVLFGKTKQLISSIEIGDNKAHFTLEEFLQFTVFMRTSPDKLLENIAIDLKPVLTLAEELIRNVTIIGKREDYLQKANNAYNRREALIRERIAEKEDRVAAVTLEINLALQRIRIAKGVSQRKMAKLMNVTPDNHNKTENGVNMLSMYNIIYMSLLLGMTPAEVFREVNYDWHEFDNIDCIDIHYCEDPTVTLSKRWKEALRKIQL